ncbi:transcription factor TGA like domain-containing protein [Artemisia annua]|uniref:Transcription factor TGA like domain-containing protein n=1 Tax=Artemisia annua TaxID=35608 RepID=A0A2U1L113_ARTAN|nr:transcription factor TGA like domain-containing protein [Artemisia annua]
MAEQVTQQHFQCCYQNWMAQHASRARLAKHDGPSFLLPTWGTTIENSLLWIGGCKPSLIIQLVYTLCGSQLDAHFAEFLDGVRHGNMGYISTSQLKNIDDLRAKTVEDEDKLNSRVENLQAYNTSPLCNP